MKHEIYRLSSDEQQSYLDPLCRHFAIDPQVFAPYVLIRMAKRSLYLFPKDCPDWQPRGRMSIEGLGISFLRLHNMALAKPSFEACAWLLPHARAHVLQLDQASAQWVRQGAQVPLTPDLRAQLPDYRSLLLCHWQGISFGSLHWNGEQLQSFFPKRYGHMEALWPGAE